MRTAWAYGSPDPNWEAPRKIHGYYQGVKKNAENLGMIGIGYKAKNEGLRKPHVSMNLDVRNEIPKKPTIEGRRLTKLLKEKEGAKKGNKKQRIPLLLLPFFN